ncbi:hypothetical protein [Microcoleus sp. K5-D4]|uniref:hypothetical protein n=1 Tax=Microcoleus sp. K5-D4 TaxID=2818801 RepID=UPI002FD750C3
MPAPQQLLGSGWEPLSRGSASNGCHEMWRQSLRICFTRLCLVTSEVASTIAGIFG